MRKSKVRPLMSTKKWKCGKMICKQRQKHLHSKIKINRLSIYKCRSIMPSKTQASLLSLQCPWIASQEVISSSFKRKTGCFNRRCCINFLRMPRSGLCPTILTTMEVSSMIGRDMSLNLPQVMIYLTGIMWRLASRHGTHPLSSYRVW
jgi:hypothetical protein